MMRFSSRVMRSAVRAPATMRKVQWQPTRFASTVISEELNEETEFLQTMEKPDVPAGWEVQYKTGDGYFRMTSKTGEAEVLIDVEFKEKKDEELNFTAFVTKNGITADFSLFYSTSGGLSLEAMTTYNKKSSAIDLTPEAEVERCNRYEGPTIADLDNTPIPAEIMSILSAVGVHNALGEFIIKHAAVLEQSAYMNFLDELKELA
eukprot:TRINITY_DN5889_c2_g1_i1.p1 TRINITY_DN5889_c2_g1~~TRINITY_DN5889_c2_g1_i1.p1  ORF type:complete len:205 (+),score=58.52 TRINITY_DN5889_c2_g1_i1:68-682(+)